MLCSLAPLAGAVVSAQVLKCVSTLFPAALAGAAVSARVLGRASQVLGSLCASLPVMDVKLGTEVVLLSANSCDEEAPDSTTMCG